MGFVYGAHILRGENTERNTRVLLPFPCQCTGGQGGLTLE